MNPLEEKFTGNRTTAFGPLPEDWEVVRLGEVTSLIRNGLVYKEKQIKSSKSILPITRIETISDGVINFQKMGQVSGLSDPDIEKWRLRPGDILFSHINSLEHIGKVAIYEGKPEILIHGMNLLCIRPIKEKISSYFLFYWFIFARNRGVFKNMSKKAVNQASINQSEMKRLKLPLPPLPEQRRIAGVLLTVDEAIFKVEQEIEHTERLKRGLMQHLLTRGIGHTRFKDSPLGSIPEDWKVVRLGDCTLTIKQMDPYDRERFWYIDISSIDNSAHKIVNPQQIEGKDAPSRARKLVHADDVIFSTTRPYLKNIAIVPMELDGQICSTGFCILRANREKVLPQWIYYYVTTNRFIRRIESKMRGATYPAVSDKDVYNEKIPLPPLPEQKRIAEILMTVDRKLELLRQKKERLERLKKGLMNDLLTGRRRLKVGSDLPSPNPFHKGRGVYDSSHSMEVDGKAHLIDFMINEKNSSPLMGEDEGGGKEK